MSGGEPFVRGEVQLGQVPVSTERDATSPPEQRDELIERRATS